MELIERYIHQVRLALPKNMREDVGKELRSSLEDSLEGRGINGVADEAVQAELLLEMGPPKELARSYLPRDRYLVGPDHYNGFLLTVKICIGVLASMTFFGFLVQIPDLGDLGPIGSRFVSLLDNFVDSSLMTLAIVVVIFSLIERGSRSRRVAGVKWDPRSLPEVQDPDQESRVGVMIQTVLFGAALVVFNFYPEQIGSYLSMDDHSGWVPLLGDTFREMLPWLNTCFLSAIAINLVVMRKGRWSMVLRGADLLVTLGFAVYLFQAAFAPDFIQTDVAGMLADGWSPDQAEFYRELVETLISRIVHYALLAGFVGALVTLGSKVVGIVRRMARQGA